VSELRWEDEKAVAEWVDRELKADCLRLQEAADKWRANHPDLPPPLSALEMVAINALVEAELGNLRLLVEALDPNHPLNSPEPGERPLRSYLPPPAWQIVVDVLTGVRNPLTGRRKEHRNGKVERKRGPSTGVLTRVRSRAPVGTYFAVVKKLSAQFPERKPKDIKSRALSIASERWRLSENTLANKLKKAATERRKKRDPYSAK
jgi:hypothetical protein